jgi:hypothetical protein
MKKLRPDTSSFETADEGLELIKAFRNIHDPDDREILLAIAHLMAAKTNFRRRDQDDREANTNN